jgi:predicted nucleic acid-binding protein
MKFLLDNDVFLSAIYRKHESHAVSRAWLDSSKKEGWGIAAETYLAAIRLLMNPSVMGSGAFTAREALDAVEAELEGSHPGRVVMAPRKPDRRLLEKAEGHRQVMDFWLLQIARDSGSKLATRDAGILSHWPADSHKVA